MPKMLELTLEEMNTVSEILWRLASEKNSFGLRCSLLPQIMDLLRADYGASYVWDSISQTSRDGIVINIDESAIRQHDTEFQYIDPITPLLSRKTNPTRVCDLMPHSLLSKTRYYQEFLKPNGLRYGINVFFTRNHTDLGDLRIWRSDRRPAFSHRESQLLAVLQPYFSQALPHPSLKNNQLTCREREVAGLVSKGLTDKEVARILDISFTTVRTHLTQALRKLEYANRTELAYRKFD
ncbi:LuxR C-terminal-related transcriptional regulator [Pantoea stewartii]|uniref:helix-turn-helix transcriptional regulator n=1 Tax=Pantoea stewartii TaxID=66269 RepID=UPI0023F9FE7E|nr:LuxR family transcriptional regulator [Pantoea stewartii]MDF7787989.1 LuxR C-terminal-related transcriptional regulator [Pantoea stewartii]